MLAPFGRPVGLMNKQPTQQTPKTINYNLTNDKQRDQFRKVLYDLLKTGDSGEEAVQKTRELVEEIESELFDKAGCNSKGNEYRTKCRQINQKLRVCIHYIYIYIYIHSQQE